MFRTTLVLAAATLASAASAGVINVSQIGGGLILNSGPAPVVLAEPSFAPGSLAALHAAMNASGVVTDGRITFAAIDTQAGLGMIALIDQIAVPGAAAPGNVHFDGVSDGTSTGYTTDPILITPGGGPTRVGFGDYSWNSNGDGDAFAWASLSIGTNMTWRFQTNGPLGLDVPTTFQFVTWTGAGWSALAVDPSQLTFSANGEYGFSANVAVPTPGVASLAALAGVAGLRRRRR